MALNIRNPDADRLASEVAALSGQTKTAAVIQALRERSSRMMVIDSFAILAILQDGPERRLSAASLVELSSVIEARIGPDGLRDLDLFLATAGIVSARGATPPVSTWVIASPMPWPQPAMPPCYLKARISDIQT